MQAVAREMNLAEPTFLPSADAGYELRWFTPVVEVDLYGHATLASTHVLWQSGRVLLAETIRFQTRSGLPTVRREGERIELDCPATPPAPVEPPPELEGGLGVKPLYVGKSRFDYLAELDSEQAVCQLRPDFR